MMFFGPVSRMFVQNTVDSCGDNTGKVMVIQDKLVRGITQEPDKMLLIISII